MGHRPSDHPGDRAQRDRLSPGPGPVHGGAQTGSAGAATLRVVRRFGAAAGAASPSPADRRVRLGRGLACRPRLRGGLGRRVGRRRGVGRGLGRVRGRGRRLAGRPRLGGRLRAVVAFAAAGLRVARAFGAVDPAAIASRLDRLAIPVDDRFGRRGRWLGRSAGCRLLRDLGPEQGLELGRDVAPWLVRATGDRRRCRAGRSVPARGPRAAAAPAGSGRSRPDSG